MKLGIISKPEEASFDKAKTLGLEFVEFDCNCKDGAPFFPGMPARPNPDPASDAFALLDLADTFKAAIDRTGVSIGAVGRWASRVFDENGKVIQNEYNQVTALLDFCAKLNVPVYCISLNKVPGLSLYKNITAAIGYLNQIVEYASKSRTKVAVVNCMTGGHYIRVPEMWELVLPEVPGLGIKYDPSHSFVHGGPKGDYIEEALGWGDKFTYVHLKGVVQGKAFSEERIWRLIPQLSIPEMMSGARAELGELHRWYDNPPAGLDVINWPAFLAILYKHHYDGMLSIEPHSRTWMGELGEKGIKFTVDYFKNLII